MLHRSALFGLAALAIGLIGCGGHQSDSSVGFREGNPLTATQINSLGKRMNTQYYQLKLVKKVAHPIVELQKWAKVQPEVVSTSIDEPRGVLQLNLKMGKPFLFLDDFQNLGAPKSPRREVGGLSLPSAVKVRFLGGTGDEFRYWKQYVPLYTAMLKDAGYKTVTSAPFTVESLLASNGNGLLAINAHGGYHGISKLSFLASETVVTDANEKTYAKEIAALDGLFYMRHFIPILGIQTGANYGILPGFVRRNLKLAPHALAILYVCFQGESKAALMQAAFHLAGADGVIGWNGKASTYGVDNLYTLFDQLLGSEKPDTMISKLDPPQRPFDIGPVWSNLAKHKVTTDGGNGSVIRYFPKPGSETPVSFGILRPSIQDGQLQGVPGQDKLMLRGVFGVKQGKVKVNGEEITVKRWNANEIEAAVPDTGKGAYGPVIVEVDGIKSNERILACWENPISATIKGNGTQVAKVSIQLKMRSMLQNGRSKPATAPVKDPFMWPVVLNEASTGSFSGSGTYKTANDEVTWSGSGVLVATNDQGGPGTNKITLWSSPSAGTYAAFILDPRELYGSLVVYPKIIQKSKEGTKVMPSFPVPLLNGNLPSVGDSVWSFKVGGPFSANSALIIPKVTLKALVYPPKDEPR